MDDRRRRNLAAVAGCAFLAIAAARPRDDAMPSPERIQAVQTYIKKA